MDHKNNILQKYNTTGGENEQYEYDNWIKKVYLW